MDIDIDTAADTATPCAGWCGIGEVASLLVERNHPRRDGRDPSGLATRAEFLGLDRAEVIKCQPIVRVAELPKLFRPDELEAVAGDIGELEARTIDLRAAGRLLDLARLAPEDLLGLLGRRGVAVTAGPDGRPEVSRSGAIWLVRILAAERMVPTDPADWRDGRPLLGLFRSAMATGLGDVRGELRADAEVRGLCELWGIRHAMDDRVRDEQIMARATLKVLTFDAARLLGFDAFAAAGAPIPAEIAEGYREKMAAAYRQALGLEPTDEPPADPTDEAEPSAGSESVPTRRGRKPAAVAAI